MTPIANADDELVELRIVLLTGHTYTPRVYGLPARHYAH